MPDKDTLWILTEEKPKVSVISKIIDTYCADFNDTCCNCSNVKIKPIFEDGVFKFQYLVEGMTLSMVGDIRILIVSGSSSFVDFLLFKQKEQPMENGTDVPIMAIEETKTCDIESRNTGVYQRGTKFVFIRHFYPTVKLYMLYNDENAAGKMKRPSQTSIFGTNLLLTIGVNIIGKDLKWFNSFSSIDDILNFKSKMRNPPNGERIIIAKNDDSISISSRLDKRHCEGKISHDPNIGALTILAKCFRDLGWRGKIVVTNHHIEQRNINTTRAEKNKFLYVCHLLGMTLDGISLPDTILPSSYWHYDMSSEKVASILLHVQAEYRGLKEVYQNHAGCERGYFICLNDNIITLPKKDKNGINLYLPDLVMADSESKNVLLIEGKKLSTLKAGLDEICDYDSIENEYIHPQFPGYNVIRGVSIFGGSKDSIPAKGVMFYLNNNGNVFVSDDAPVCIKQLFKDI